MILQLACATSLATLLLRSLSALAASGVPAGYGLELAVAAVQKESSPEGRHKGKNRSVVSVRLRIKARRSYMLVIPPGGAAMRSTASILVTWSLS
jgi:hypothetical protein